MLGLVGLVAVVAAAGATAGTAAGLDGAGSELFSVSRVAAVAVSGEAATRYSVVVTGVPAGDAPTYTWYLHLRGGGSACSDAVVVGGRRVSADEYVWVNQQASFVWYYGRVGSYPADRSYGCDQAELGHGGYPGTVTLSVENEYQHCSAGFAGIAPASGHALGAPARCALGGYGIGASTLPVPAALLALYRRVDSEIGGLVARARRGAIGARALATALSAIEAQQASAFARLFPAVWGCAFDGVFDDVSAAKVALDTQTAQVDTGRRPSHAALAADAVDMRSVASGVAACEQSAADAGGAPRAVVRAVERLSADTDRLPAAALGASGLSRLRTALPAIATGLDSVVAHDFPTVFGMPYIDLVERTLTVASDAGLAERAALSGQTAATAAALERALAPERATGLALRTQERRVVAVENRNS